MVNRAFLACCGLVFVAVLAAGGTASAEPSFGGTLVVAMPAEPAHFDLHATTLNYTRYIAWHVVETLFTADEDFNPVPLLAESYTVSDDGKTYSIVVRQNVLFHNGKEMTSEDVVASIKRTVSRNTMLGAFNVKDVRETGRYSLDIELHAPMGLLITALAVNRYAVAIMPKELVEAAGRTSFVTEYIGTGPYKFSEWRRGQYVLLERFDEYVPRDEAPAGYGGARVPYLNQIKIMFVAEPSVRAVGVAAGDFHLAWPLTPDDMVRLAREPRVRVLKSAPWMYSLIFNNKSPGLGGQRSFRQAVQAALDCEEILIGVAGNPDAYRLDPGIMWIETAWHSTLGADLGLYNQANPARARQILADMGYRNQPVVIVTSTTEANLLNIALIVEQQLKAVGINVDLRTYDMATSKQVLTDPNLWDISPLDSTYRDHPLMHTSIDESKSAGWANAEKDALVEQLYMEGDPAKAFAIWEAIEALYYTEVPIIKLGDYFEFIAVREEVRGFMNLPEFFFWNVWLED